MVNFRTIFTLCMAQALLLSIISLTFQLIVVHQMEFNPGSDGMMNLGTSANGGVSGAVVDGISDTRLTIAYTVTLTGCGGDKRYSTQDAMGLITQGAAVLRHSIAMAHSPQQSKYNYQMYAIVHPVAKECSRVMEKLGYTVLIRNTPFDKKDIQQEFLRENIDRASCCGEKEFIKLYAYTLVQHPVAVILDLDSLILQPLDSLYDAMIGGEDTMEETRQKLPIHKGVEYTAESPFPKRIDAFYTKDYNMVNAGNEAYAGVQGGFLVVRPSEATFDEYIDIVLEGNYIEGRGWGGKYGYFFGGMQIQGICAYYYGEDKHPETGVELNRCRINSMVDSPYFSKDDKKKPGECRDGVDGCEDCRNSDLSR
ncbi:predicted protein [Thalassiosira pseudonana CCMP1335]|uniref:Nucleotide-diphospho-sugar transferase domain-containing protein n=1 Tax=Thalassiosira pseudonana TaxID=35128 RepID=B8C0W8_THAPS|nr:predicted protein [Thalassiosira pseudonana CCMP1335]EED92678.1 predicted protein [Thalassiosira pseudonana CCMP1335]